METKKYITEEEKLFYDASAARNKAYDKWVVAIDNNAPDEKIDKLKRSWDKSEAIKSVALIEAVHINLCLKIIMIGVVVVNILNIKMRLCYETCIFYWIR